MNIKNMDETLEKLISLGWFLSGSGAYFGVPAPGGKYVGAHEISWIQYLMSDKELSEQRTLNRISEWISGPDCTISDTNFGSSMKGKKTERYQSIKFVLNELDNTLAETSKRISPKKHEILKKYYEMTKKKKAEEITKFNALSEQELCELVSEYEMVLFDLDNPSENVLKTAFLNSNPKGIIYYEENRYFYQVYEILAALKGKKVGATCEEREAIKPEDRLTPEENIAIMRQMPALAYLILKEKVTEEEANVALEVFPELLFVNRIFGENIEYLYYNPLALEIMHTQGENKLGSGVCEEILKNNLTLTKKNPKLKEIAPTISEKSIMLYVELLARRTQYNPEMVKRVGARVREKNKLSKNQTEFLHSQSEGYNG